MNYVFNRIVGNNGDVPQGLADLMDKVCKVCKLSHFSATERHGSAGEHVVVSHQPPARPPAQCHFEVSGVDTVDAPDFPENIDVDQALRTIDSNCKAHCRPNPAYNAHHWVVGSMVLDGWSVSHGPWVKRSEYSSRNQVCLQRCIALTGSAHFSRQDFHGRLVFEELIAKHWVESTCTPALIHHRVFIIWNLEKSQVLVHLSDFDDFCTILKRSKNASRCCKNHQYPASIPKLMIFPNFKWWKFWAGLWMAHVFTSVFIFYIRDERSSFIPINIYIHNKCNLSCPHDHSNLWKIVEVGVFVALW